MTPRSILGLGTGRSQLKQNPKLKNKRILKKSTAKIVYFHHEK